MSNVGLYLLRFTCSEVVCLVFYRIFDTALQFSSSIEQCRRFEFLCDFTFRFSVVVLYIFAVLIFTKLVSTVSRAAKARRSLRRRAARMIKTSVMREVL